MPLFPPIGVFRRPPSLPVSNPDQSVTKGRNGVVGAQARQAISDVFQFEDTPNIPATKSYLLTTDSSYIGFVITVTATAANTNAGAENVPDILNVFSQINILDDSGNIVSMIPNIDFYNFAQRFSTLHTIPAVTEIVVPGNSSASASATYRIPGVNLPLLSGSKKYTLQVVTQAASGVTGVSFTDVTITLSMIPGAAPRTTHYVYSGLPFTPTANGFQDLGVNATIQNVDLEELFMNGLTSNVADISYLQIQSVNGTVGGRVFASDLVARIQTESVGALPATALYPLLALKTSARLGGSHHFYLQFGATPSSSIRLGYYWLA